MLRALELADADERILNELYGFVNRCATQSAAFEQDYVITIGTARLMAGMSRYNALVSAARYCGYFSDVTVKVDGEDRPAFKLIEDNDLFHMILKAEREWTNQRKRDTRDPKKTAPVRARDGDACRYCGKSVSWGDTKSGRGATYDHTVPGEEGTFQTMVVCCRECNGRRQDDPDSTWKPLPAPAEPLYGPATVVFLAKHGIDVEQSYTRTQSTPIDAPAANGTQDETAVEPQKVAPAQDEATEAASGPSNDSPAPRADRSSGEAATAHPAAEGPAGDPPDAGGPPGPKPDPGQRYPGPGFVGTGRDGSGRVGTGREGHALAGAGRAGRRRKRPRKR
ncbi:hypothetical protein JTF08_13630 [Micrococcaceae bacterium RIT802]|nr:hypothetical protein [Micrococcaceae bacterium RIT 802]